DAEDRHRWVALGHAGSFLCKHWSRQSSDAAPRPVRQRSIAERNALRGSSDWSAARQRASRAARGRHSLWSHRNLVLGIPAIFIYLIAEIGVSNLLINFVSQPDIGNLTHEQASRYLFLLWGGMMVGRFAGSWLMRSIAPEKVLAAFSIAAFVVMLVTVLASGRLAMWALVSVGLFRSIMFPTIFTLAIRGLGPLTEEGSGLLVMAIAGGALVVVQGWLADRYGLQLSFLLTAACELYVLFYALWGAKPAHVPVQAPAPAQGVAGEG